MNMVQFLINAMRSIMKFSFKLERIWVTNMIINVNERSIHDQIKKNNIYIRKVFTGSWISQKVIFYVNCLENTKNYLVAIF